MHDRALRHDRLRRVQPRFELQFDVHSDVYDEVFNTQSRVLVAILKAFNAAGIEFAYPTQTTFTAAPDGRLVMPYADAGAAREQRRADTPPSGLA